MVAKWRRRPSCYNRFFPRSLQKNVKRRIRCSTRRKRETVIENETSPFEATAKRRQSVRPRTLQKVAKVQYCMRNQFVHLLLRMQIACKTNWPRRPKVWNISRKRTAQGSPKRQLKKHGGDLEGPKTWNIHRKRDFGRIFKKFSKSRQAESVKHSAKTATTTRGLDLPAHRFTIGILQFWRKSCQKCRTVVKNGGGSRSGGSTIIFIKKQ